MRRMRANVIAGVMAEIESCLPEAGHRLPESERASCRRALFQSPRSSDTVTSNAPIAREGRVFRVAQSPNVACYGRRHWGDAR